MAYPELFSLSKGIESTIPWVQYAFMEKEKEKARKQKFVSDYYMDLLKRGEIEQEVPGVSPVSPLVSQIPSVSPLAGYLRPPTPATRPIEEEGAFDIMEALAGGEGLPPGFRVTEPVIPEGLKPFEMERRGVTYRRPYEARPTAEIIIEPTAENIKSFSAYMPGYKWEVGVAQSVPVSSYNRYLSSVRGYKAPDYIKQRDRVLDQATTMWKEYLKSPDVAKLSSADMEKLYLEIVRMVAVQLRVPISQAETILEDPSTLEKFSAAVGVYRFPAQIKRETDSLGVR